MRALKGYLFIIGATTFWGISATIAKFLFTHNFDTLVLVQMRMTLSCIVMLLFFLIFKRHLLKIEVKDLFQFALLGIFGLAGSNFTYYFTINVTNVATAILLQYLAPLLVLMYAAFTSASGGEEKVTAVKISAGLVSLAGCYLAVTGKDFSILSINQLGLLTGLASAFCWAFTNVWLRRLLKRYNVWTCLVYAFLSASFFWLLINPPWKIFTAHYSSDIWLTFFGFAMISILIPHSLYFLGMRFLTASRAVITATFEPIVAIVSAFFIINELLTPIQMVGAVLVIGAIAILQIKKDEENTVNPIPRHE